MFSWHRMLMIVGGLALLTLTGCERTPPGTVERDFWILEMQRLLPSSLCEDESYFRQCFEVTVSECSQLAEQTTRECLDEIAPQLPEAIAQPHEGRVWGERVGQCAGSRYEIAVIGKKRQTVKCATALPWAL